MSTAIRSFCCLNIVNLWFTLYIYLFCDNIVSLSILNSTTNYIYSKYCQISTYQQVPFATQNAPAVKSTIYIAKIPARLATTYIRICYGFSYSTHPIRNVGCWLLCVWPHPTCIDGAIACKRQRTRKRYLRGRLETRRTPGKGRYRGVFGMGYVASRDFDSVDSELYLYMKHNISISAATVSSSSARRLYLWAMC